jgi:hypothetical protein
MEVLAEGEYDQGRDDEPAIVKPDLDSINSSQFDIGSHPQPSSREPMQLRITGVT